MPKISSYTSVTPSLTDKLIGTDANDSLSTKNFTVGSILNLYGGATLELTSSSTATQDPDTNVLTQIVFQNSGTVSGSNASLDAAGNLTFSTEGTYYIDLGLHKGLTGSITGAGMKQMSFGVFKNGTQTMYSIKDTQYYPANAGIGNGEYINMSFLINVSADDVLTFKMITNVSSIGLVSQSQAELSVIPSANITVFKF